VSKCVSVRECGAIAPKDEHCLVNLLFVIMDKVIYGENNTRATIFLGGRAKVVPTHM